MSGKGDNPRPFSVTQEQFNERFDAIDWNAREREANQRYAQFFCTTPDENLPCSICGRDKP